MTSLYFALVCLFGCTDSKSNSNSVKNEETTMHEKKDKYELALISDLGTIEDHSFNQASWEGIKKYAEENDISYVNYQPEEGTPDEYVETIELAIQQGAKVIICPGYNFEIPVYRVQDVYPEVTFLLIDGEPHNIAYNESKIAQNVLAILFQEEQAGFLAGYAAVKDGYTKLGFIGGMAVPAVVRYGYGFVQGCDLAAKELGIKVDINYTYVGTFQESEEASNLAASWYQNKTQVIFACGGAIGNSVIEAAKQEKAKVIGVDADQSMVSDTVITSAMKMVTEAVYRGIERYYTGKFTGGSTQLFSVDNNGVGLPMNTSKFQMFTKTDYEKIYQKLVKHEIGIYNQVEDSTTKDLTLEATNIHFIH